ncbi:hypothetical protein [Priestia aryabhattai]|uniref:hypothetical protein n=1 Tax=Priestia aryabhattai TaxID=412384 RepID=UPI00203E5009|nr:hypothetical protein [Priestia aryabhattai]MCM3252450.1 hypothetical protein [Priestia aryabhattai]
MLNKKLLALLLFLLFINNFISISVNAASPVNVKESTEEVRNYDNFYRPILEGFYFVTASIFPIIIGFYTIVIAKKAKEITSNQLELTKRVYRPRFMFDLKYTVNKKTLPIRESLTIRNANSDGWITEKELKFYTFLQVKVYHSTNKTLNREQSLLIYNYYTLNSGKLQNVEGRKLESTLDENNWEFFCNLERDFRDYIKTNYDAFGELDIKRYINVSYQDSFEELQNEFYFVDTLGGNKLKEEEKNKFLEKINEQEQNDQYLSLFELSSEHICKGLELDK